MTKRQRLLLVRQRRQVCETNRRAPVRAQKPLGLRDWLSMLSTPSLGTAVAITPCCQRHTRNLGRLKAHLVAKHGMSKDWSGFADFEAEYVAATLGVGM